MGYKNAQDVVEAIIHAYYSKRNMENIFLGVTEDIEWLCEENNDSATGKEALKKLLENNDSNFSDTLDTHIDNVKVQEVSKDVAVISIKGTWKIDFKDSGCDVFWITACCIRTKDGWLVKNIHISAPNAEVSKKEKQSILNDLQSEREKQVALLSNIPGGIAMYRVKKDGRIPADYVSEGLAKICGYDDGKDIMKVMAYDSRKLVLPEDYPIVAKACKHSIENGVPTSINYRICRKDGKVVRITLDSIVIKNVTLGEDDVALFYAVQSLVSEETNLIMEKQKMQNSLLNSVPAGIGIYEINSNGFFQVYMNDTFYALLGSDREERKKYFGSNALSAIHPSDVARVKEKLMQFKEGMDSIEVDYRLKNSSGNWLWFHVTGCVVERKENYIKIYASLYECTEAKQQQLLLLHNQRAVELAQRRGNLSIWTYNLDKHLIAQQTTLDVEGHLGYPIIIENVPEVFVENKSIHPDDLDKYLEVYKKLEEGAQKVDEIYRIINLNSGTYTWVHMYYQRLKDTDDGERVAAGFSLDISKQQDAIERYQLEQKLREQAYRDAQISAEYNLTKNQYTSINTTDKLQLLENLQSSSVEEFKERISETIDRKYVDKVVEKIYAENLLKAFAKGKSQVSCEYLSKVNGVEPAEWYRMTVLMAQNPTSGDVMGFYYVENIEENVMRRLALESGMRDGVESLSVIHIPNKKAKIIGINASLKLKNNYRCFVYNDAFVNRVVKDVLLEERKFCYQAALLSTVLRELKNKEIYQYAVTVKEKEGELKRKIIRYMFLDDRKCDIVMTIRDITVFYREEQEKNKQLQVALVAAEEANKAKTDFLSRVSHDMRTPLNGILGLTALLRNKVIDSDVLKDLKDLEMSGEYLLNLINDTLDMNRIESGKIELQPIVCSGRDVFNNTLGLAKASLKEKNIELHIDLEAIPFTTLYIDVTRIEQIVMNVIGNAVKFTPPGGGVFVTLKNLSVEDGVITDELIIRDTGIGMSPEFLSHIFEPFSQENTSKTGITQGTGLGMAITKQLVNKMGGDIKVTSELGKGTCFIITLKLNVATEEQIEASKCNLNNEGKWLDFKGKRVLLCEDHHLNIKIASRLLETKGFVVEQAENGRLGVDMFKASAENYYDVILMDIRMPIMDGLEATKEIRSLDRKDAKLIPIVAMTANAFEDDIAQTMAAGMNAHLSKPIKTAMLFQTLRDVLSRVEH